MKSKRTKAFRASLFLWVVGLCFVSVSAAAQTRRVRLEILVISDDDVGTDMIKHGLDEVLVPYTEVSLRAAGRPRITEDFLVDAPLPGVRRARFQAVVLPNDAPAGLSEQERFVLARYEREFGVRQLDAYVYPSPHVGLQTPALPDSGPLDGTIAHITDAARDEGFDYLRDEVPFENLSEDVCESYGYLATPLAGARFTPFLVNTPSETAPSSVLLGVFEDDGREELVLTAAMNEHQLAQQVLFPGMLAWLTRGVYLGLEQSYMSVHIDDVFLSDARWLSDHNCTYRTQNCNPEGAHSDILMTPDDAEFLLAWQDEHNLKLDMVFNGQGYDTSLEDRVEFPLARTLLENKDDLRWISHTYTHAYLGCVQNDSVVPWVCARDEAGNVLWTSYEEVRNELAENLRFAERHGIKFDPTELVTGEHSGLHRAPIEPGDNPNLARALFDLGITWVGSDSSREGAQRKVNDESLTVPRYPLNIFYNTGSEHEEVDLYNWIYTPTSSGGSGLCEVDPHSSCIAPLDLQKDFHQYIVPQQARAMLLHVLSNSPRPHYAHQSNLAEDRILYPVLDAMLARYHALFTDSVPLVNATLAQLGIELRRRAAWKRDVRAVDAYIEGGTLVITSEREVLVPLTLPAEVTPAPRAFHGDLTVGWEAVAPAQRAIGLPDYVAFKR
ncbi:MAG: hypothetical protein ABW252_06485 [Polyangiales bacterium]